jgi:hypothetical protein
MGWPRGSQTAVSKYPDLTRQHDGLRQGVCEVTAEKEIRHNILAEFLQGHRFYVMSQNCPVTIASGCGLHRRGSIPHCLDGLRGPPSLLSNGHPGLFPQKQSGRAVQSTTHILLVPRSRMVELCLFSHALRLWFSLNIRDHISNPLNTTGKIIALCIVFRRKTKKQQVLN